MYTVSIDDFYCVSAIFILKCAFVCILPLHMKPRISVPVFSNTESDNLVSIILQGVLLKLLVISNRCFLRKQHMSSNITLYERLEFTISWLREELKHQTSLNLKTKNRLGTELSMWLTSVEKYETMASWYTQWPSHVLILWSK